MRAALVLSAALIALPVLAAGDAPAGPPAAPGPVEVRFKQPEKFFDATYENRPSTRAQVTKDLAAYLSENGARYLAPGQRLEIEITDVDLAGRFEPWHIEARDVRFMRESAWPRIELNYRLLEGDREIAGGQDTLSDMSYLNRSNLRTGSDRLRYEKAMLDQWLRSRFGEKKPLT